MKKLLFILTLLTSMLILSSCKVNLFGSIVDLPWYLVMIFIVLVLAVLYIFMLSETYVCRDCKTEFKPKWNQFSIFFHLNEKQAIKCPNCGKKGSCEKKK